MYSYKYSCSQHVTHFIIHTDVMNHSYAIKYIKTPLTSVAFLSEGVVQLIVDQPTRPFFLPGHAQYYSCILNEYVSGWGGGGRFWPCLFPILLLLLTSPYLKLFCHRIGNDII